MTPDLASLRLDYALSGLSEDDLAPTWLEQLQSWLSDAAGLLEPSAIVLSTVSATGRPSSRTVLLKGVDARGLVVFTNLTSQKATEALSSGFASLLLPWYELQRQVRVDGAVTEVSREESAAYWATRPRASQLGAWASRQSSVVASRDVLEAQQAAVEERFPDEVPLPNFWGGLRIEPDTVEFWQGRTARLHDRLRYRLSGGDWTVERLSP